MSALRHQHRPLHAAGTTVAVTALLQFSACSGDGGTSTEATLSVHELSAILADPIAAADCELDPSGFVALACGHRATGAAEALGARGAPEGIPALVGAILDTDTHPDAEKVSWRSLEMIGGPEAVAALVEMITAAHPVPVAGTNPDADPLRGHKLVIADQAADLLGRLGGVEHNQLLAEAGDTPFGCQDSGYFRALVSLNNADATPLLSLLDGQDTHWVYGPLIVLGQAGTEPDVVAALTAWGDRDMAECLLNSDNQVLEQAAEEWAGAHGYTITRLPGLGSPTWGSG